MLVNPLTIGKIYFLTYKLGKLYSYSATYSKLGWTGKLHKLHFSRCSKRVNPLTAKFSTAIYISYELSTNIPSNRNVQVAHLEYGYLATNP